MFAKSDQVPFNTHSSQEPSQNGRTYSGFVHAIKDDLRMARTFFGTMFGSDKQVPLNRQEYTTQNELFMEISMDLQLTTQFSCLKEIFGPTVEVSLKERNNGFCGGSVFEGRKQRFMQGSLNEHKRKMVGHEDKKQQS
ncbi:hypothetical protein Tco_1379131 [Tanacetum coccineum]